MNELAPTSDRNEPLRPETLALFHQIIDRKLDNPTVIMENPTFTRFAVEDQGLDGHDINTRIQVVLGEVIQISESFAESTPRGKPSVLSYDYIVDQNGITLLLSRDLEDNGPIATKRIEDLKAGGKIIPNGESADIDESEEGYAITEQAAQKLLASLKAMKLLIER